MFGWQELQHYHPLIALFGGIAAFFCFAGTGALGLRLLRVSNDGALHRPLQFLLGVLAISLAVQFLAMADSSSARAAQVLAALIAVSGVLKIAADFRELRRWLADARSSLMGMVWWLPFGIVATSLLVTAMTPESRADEVAYHALVPARILEDGGLRVHELPWEATIWPQLVWHYALVPVFATAGSAAARVLACCVVILLALAAARMVQARLGSEKFASIAALAVLAGAYSTSLLVSLGPHAFGCLATFTACSAVLPRRAHGGQAPSPMSGLGIGIACAGMVAGKITMLPLAILVMALGARMLAQPPGQPLNARVRTLVALSAPGVLALGPILIWGWISARSPLGVMSAGLFGSAEFGPETLRIYEGTRALFADMFNWRFELSYWNLLLVIGVVSSVILASPSQDRIRHALLLACQTAVIVLLLPKEIRHLGGLQYALFVGGFCAAVSGLRLRAVRDSWVAAASFVAVLPWAALGLFISSINLPLVIGRQTPAAFLQRYSGLFEDYQRLDRLLPPNATIVLGHSERSPTQFAWFARPPVFYAPRRIASNDHVAHEPGRVYLLYIGQGEPDATHADEAIRFDPVIPVGLRIGPPVYTNRAASFYPSRTPVSAAGRRARIDVYELKTDP